MSPAQGGRRRRPLPLHLGNSIVGRIEEVGPEVAAFARGDRVYGHLPLRDVHVVTAERIRKLPGDLTPEAAVCIDPADAALAMRDARVRLGDRVAVFGLGAIGLFALQYCRLSGAALVIAVDPLARRRDLAARRARTWCSTRPRATWGWRSAG